MSCDLYHICYVCLFFFFFVALHYFWMYCTINLGFLGVVCITSHALGVKGLRLRSAFTGSAGHCMLTRGSGVRTNARGAAHKHTLRLCGFSCGRSAHSGSDQSPSPPPPPHSHNPTIPPLVPHPRGSHSVAGHSLPQLRAGSQQLGLRQGDAWGAEGRNPRRGFIKKEGKMVAVKRRGREGKVDGRSLGVTYHIVYHIQKSQEWLSSWRLR